MISKVISKVRNIVNIKRLRRNLNSSISFKSHVNEKTVFEGKNKIADRCYLEDCYIGLVRVVIQHFLKTIVVQFVFEVIG